ncbi:hypothetical protein [Hymenobacter terricola]|uniref:hypothetical protein n=1 Tax=Hymenobacter terricola TaxID=2819236 RepID=UPI001B30372C|nr:hypothetical protein [Hymenobacter terricola]
MQPVFKTRDKAAAEAEQRRYYWAMTPEQRLALAVRLNEHARYLYAANPANALVPPDGRRVLKSAAPIPRRKR